MMRIQRKIIEIDEELCDGCGNCVPSCAEGALKVIDGKAKLVSEVYCDGLGACLGECPTGALKVVEREAEEFDEEAVEEYLSREEEEEKDAPLACGCPSSLVQTFTTMAPDRELQVDSRPSSGSRLTHWPVQIRLVPSNAPFLKGADILVAADCAPVAYPDFHRDFLPGKVVLVGCPKFDPVREYIHKFAEIFAKARVKTVTVLTMQVPCCRGLPHIVQKAMEEAGVRIPVENIVIDSRGKVVGRENPAV